MILLIPELLSLGHWDFHQGICSSNPKITLLDLTKDLHLSWATTRNCADLPAALLWVRLCNNSSSNTARIVVHQVMAWTISVQSNSRNLKVTSNPKIPINARIAISVSTWTNHLIYKLCRMSSTMTLPMVITILTTSITIMGGTEGTEGTWIWALI